MTQRPTTFRQAGETSGDGWSDARLFAQLRKGLSRARPGEPLLILVLIVAKARSVSFVVQPLDRRPCSAQARR